MIIYGHRGARGEAPENTLAGFTTAYRHGIRHFELDVQLSSDGIPVVIHDLTLERTTGKTGKVANQSVAELSRLDARTNTAPWPDPVGVPTLEQVLDACPEVAHYQLEVKPDGRNRLNILCNRLTEMIQRRKLFETVVVTSSDGWFLQQIKRRNRKIHTGYVAGRRFPRPVITARRLECSYLIPSWRICSADMVNQAHRHDMQVSVWTVNRIHDMLLMEDMGVNSIITDFPTSTRIYFDNRAVRLPRPSEATAEQEEGHGATTA
ncbi:glycerophosphoryl diester phosphodiesterase [Marinobacter segnicrescens]|uniref:Glycerophosphoryl diester phosphodiesterase n=1 Tax=Marinobacter segnicrescens TaxID=430453 RepID=A0A1H9YZH1_9GAMM|nr:glycerophosphodiester phosphodiesterase [Marinobacter segnicrescens]SES74552.1 glycerophosphoryl diester phosphodiesterase [Marinobacter segnicrescens]